MSRIGDYSAGIKYWTVDRDVERLLSGAEPYDSDMAPLVALMSDMAAMGRITVPEQFIADHAGVAAATVTGNPAIVVGKVANLRSRLDLRRRFAGSVAGLAMLSGLSGVAMAADSAIPGDWNYGIDQALELIGIGDGGADERLAELLKMNETGRSVEVLEYTSNVLDSVGEDEASLALSNAADRVLIGQGNEHSRIVREQVSALLSYLAENKGKIDGQSVAEISKGIGNGNGPPETTPGNGNGNGPPETTPGNGNGNGNGNGK